MIAIGWRIDETKKALACKRSWCGGSLAILRTYIDRRIARHMAPLENIVKLLAIIITEKDIVMRQFKTCHLGLHGPCDGR